MTDPDRRAELVESYENAAVIVSGIRADEVTLRTPCSGYDVAGLIDHLVEAAYRAAALGRGQSPRPETTRPPSNLPMRLSSYGLPPKKRHRPGRTIPDCRLRSPCPGVRSTRGRHW